ncbi:MAG: 2-amino-4-hydroxy-6-hydroxymethyldihydropteridine diphosphokinase [Spirochaeta sp.]|nr:2-amino-4-hydroxy-6-hydroxymethyldihydropteridine diphosphokinase [Spirochaeta sp.]
MIENAGEHGHTQPGNASDYAANRVFLSLGSNVGDRLMYLREASHRLGAHLTRLQASSVYETAPMYLSNQPAFLNAVLEGYFVGSPHDLLAISNTIEAQLGRDRQLEVPKGPRSLDIDLLLFGDLVLQSIDLEIPHPGLLERAFVLQPLLEIAPKLKHPQHKVPIAELVQIDLAKGIYRQEQILV